MSQNNPQYNYQMPPQQQMPPRPVYPQRPVTKSKFLTFCCALMPGAGQMYHGLIRKGLSVMILFFGIIALSSITYMPVLCAAFPVIWFYSFFDAVNRMNMPVQEMRMLHDDWLFSNGTVSFAGHGFSFSEFFQKRHTWIGVALILIAVWIFFNSAFSLLTQYFWDNFVSDEIFWAVRGIFRFIPVLIVPVLCVLLGVKLIKGSSRNQPPMYDEYTVPDDSEQM